MSNQSDLADLIRSKFVGVEPDSQDTVLEDHDWNLILAALQAAPEPEIRGEVTDEWADRFCEAVNWSPDGEEWKTVEGVMRGVTFRDLAKGYILSAIATQPGQADPVAGVGEAERLPKCLEIANANHEKFERLWYLETDKVDRLKLAICGGEDVPGAIDAVSVEDCEGFIREERARHVDTEVRLEHVRRSRDSAGDRAQRLHMALAEVRDSVETFPLDDTSTCMCGSPVEGHNVGSGHAPVSQADHAISLIVETINKALSDSAPPVTDLIGRPDDYEGPDAGMHDTEIVEDDSDDLHEIEDAAK